MNKLGGPSRGVPKREKTHQRRSRTRVSNEDRKADQFRYFMNWEPPFEKEGYRSATGKEGGKGLQEGREEHKCYKRGEKRENWANKIILE